MDNPPQRKKRGGITLTPGGCLLALALNLAILAAIGWPLWQANLAMRKATVTPAPTRTPSATLPPSATASLTPLPPPSATPTAAPLNATPFSLPQWSSGPLFLSIQEGRFSHLFAYQPPTLPLTRLTSGQFDDITPAVSPDGRQIVFASNRDGYWDLYLMELSSGKITRLTNTPQYDGAPSWSPDGQWLAFETLLDGNLEIAIRAVSDENTTIRLTQNPGADFSPAWSPGGRQIAFVSTRSGQADIWLADLDLPESERFRNLSKTSRTQENHPDWSSDGSALVWGAQGNGLHWLVLWHDQSTNPTVNLQSHGDWPVWSPNDQTLAAVLTNAENWLVTAISAEKSELELPAVSLPGKVNGLSWGSQPLPKSLPQALRTVARITPTPQWQATLSAATQIPGDRIQAVEIPNLEAPYPLLSDQADEAFNALRKAVTQALGWDFLGTLENAYVPLTAPLAPGMGDDWLYTGRGIAINTQAMLAGWMTVVRDDYGAQTYWRVYVRPRLQDGSQGQPLHSLPWDFDARFDPNPTIYEAGGALATQIPEGYWVDFTALAKAFGWERLPALLNWRTYYQGTQFQKFALRDGLTWQDAMAELFPPEILVSPSPTPEVTGTSTP